MNPLTYLTCEHCRQEFPFTDTDRQLAPILVDLHLRLHTDICEGVATQAFILIGEAERWLKEAAS